MDNGPQFISSNFQDFCDECGIKLIFSTPRYPQANGQAESLNKMMMNTFKKKLDNSKDKRVSELPFILWSYKTTTRMSSEETPFSLVYRAEAVIPEETGMKLDHVA